MFRRSVATALALTSVVLLATAVTAATPENAPEASRLQVTRALKALAPALKGRPRRLAKHEQGSIEHAISAYVPAKYHPVDEGFIPAPVANAACPLDMAAVEGRFCIDRFEGSLVERLDDGTQKPQSPYDSPAPGHTYIARSVKDVVPQAYISARQATVACEAAGKRLCRAVEWRAACGGSEGTQFPYGARRVAGRCHDSGASPMLTFHTSTMKRGWGLVELNDPRNNQLEGSVAKTGAFPDCVNDYGVYDMVGNLHEWTADTNGTFQGGYWLDTSQHGEGCAYRTIAHGYDYHDYSTGFRCCADPTARDALPPVTPAPSSRPTQ